MARTVARSRTSPTVRGTPTTTAGRVERHTHRTVEAPPRWPRLSLWGVSLLVWRATKRTARWGYRWREATLPALVGAVVDLLWTPTLVAGIVAIAARFATQPLHRDAVRGRRMHRHGRTWRKKCKALGIIPTPRIVTFDDHPAIRTLTVELPETTLPDVFAKQRRAIGNTYRARDCRLTDLTEGRWRIHLVHRDLLADDPQPPALPGDHLCIPVGVDWRGHGVAAPIFEARWLIGGTSGAGKSTFLHAVLGSLTRIPNVELWLVDPIEGVDLGLWHPWATHVATTPTDAAQLIADYHRACIDRARHMAKLGISLAQPSARFPLRVLVIDELAQVLEQPGKPGKDAADDLWRIQSVGRKAGHAVIAATQDPRAEIVQSRIRALFSHTLALRCRTVTESNVILGPGMKDAGWDASKLPAGQPGRGFWASGADVREVRVFRAYGPPNSIDVAETQVAWPAPLPESCRTAIPAPSNTSDIPPILTVPPEPFRSATVVPTGDTRLDVAEALLAAGPAGVKSVELAARLGKSDRTIRYHLEQLGAARRGDSRVAKEHT